MPYLEYTDLVKDSQQDSSYEYHVGPRVCTTMTLRAIAVRERKSEEGRKRLCIATLWLIGIGIGSRRYPNRIYVLE